MERHLVRMEHFCDLLLLKRGSAQQSKYLHSLYNSSYHGNNGQKVSSKKPQAYHLRIQI